MAKKIPVKKRIRRVSKKANPRKPGVEKVKKSRPRKKPAPKKPAYISAGKLKKTIHVGLSYKIVELFSEGLYASANKAFEELVTNSFDAGARNVNVLSPSDPYSSNATIVVVDDGEAMDVSGLEALWQIGRSDKRERADLPLGRKQIGKFGIGKLATYVLANNLTYICKNGRNYFAVSMDYTQLDDAASGQISTEKPVPLKIRELTRDEAKSAVSQWTESKTFKNWGIKLFGTKALKTWTFTILSSLKDKANEIEPGRLRWILQTALPLRDDFSIFLNGEKLVPSKAGKGRIKKWILGKGIKNLSKPASADIKVRKDTNLDSDDPNYFGLFHPKLGRITGYAEGYKDTLTTGKSSDIARSNGFFVYVLGRLVNIDDEYFGIEPNKLRHGTFSRFRLIIHIDKLDEELLSNRNNIREGPVCKETRNVLNAIFNFVRPKIEEANEDESLGARISRKIAGSPASLSRRPIIELARLILAGKATSRFIRVPTGLSDSKRKKFLEDFSERVKEGTGFVSDIQLSYALTIEDGIAVFDTENFVLKINALHPFVSAFSNDFQTFKQSLPLELFAMAEVLLEAQLHHLDVDPSEIEDIVSGRDELLRYLAKSSGRRTALTVSQALSDARNDENKLEIELVAAFDKLGYESVRLSGPGKPDGLAIAHLGAKDEGKSRSYSVSLEAKSKKKGGKTVSAKTVGISTVARHREDFKCQHTLVVGPDFPTQKKEKSALVKEIKSDRDKYEDNPENEKRTITLVRIDDLAKLVRIASRKNAGPSRLREFFLSCSTPEESQVWINELAKEKTKKEPYKEIVKTIYDEQQNEPDFPVEYGVIRKTLRDRTPSIKKSNSELKEICRTLSSLVPAYLSVRENSVELEVGPNKFLEALKMATEDDPEDDDKDENAED